MEGGLAIPQLLDGERKVSKAVQGRPTKYPGLWEEVAAMAVHDTFSYKTENTKFLVRHISQHIHQFRWSWNKKFRTCQGVDRVYVIRIK